MCVCVCVCVRVCACIYGLFVTNVCACMHTRIVQTNEQTNTNIRRCTHPCISHAHTTAFGAGESGRYVQIYVYPYIQYRCRQRYRYVANTCTYIHTHTHTQTDTHIHTCTPSGPPALPTPPPVHIPVSLICLPYMSTLYVCLICLP